MKKQDFIFIICLVFILMPFFISEDLIRFYNNFNLEHGMISSFIKFSILATIGESIGLRIKTGKYNSKGFGLIPRAVVWGFLGLTIKMSFVIFTIGTPAFLSYIGFTKSIDVMKGSFSGNKLLVSFSISAAMNLIYAPVMMTLHKITDLHIVNNGGSLKCLFKKIKFEKIISSMNWSVHWNFVIKKTIPFFWIPAHTITFLLPEQYQVLFAAILSVVLGVLLAIASQTSSK